MVAVVIYALQIFPSTVSKTDNTSVAWLSIVTMSLVQVISATFVIWLFGYIFVNWKIKVIPSIFMGSIIGGVCGFITGGLTWGILFVIAVPSGVIPVRDNFGFGTAWYEVLAFTFLAAGTFGSMFGATAGFVLGPIIRLIMRIYEKRERVKE